MKKLANNKKVLNRSLKIAKAIELEAEEILLHTEELVKSYVPARKVKATLLKVEKALENEGVESLFDKKVTREALRKTASEEVTDEEIDELVDAIVKAVVEELEEVLEDADEVCGDCVDGFKGECEFEVESKLKTAIEKSMARKGINFKLARVNKPAKKEASKKAPAKKTLLNKIVKSK